jgi:hypothetical protein
MNFSPCDGTAQLALDRFYPEAETYHIDEDYSEAVPIIQNSWKETFKEYVVTGGFSIGVNYMFPLKVETEMKLPSKKRSKP